MRWRILAVLFFARLTMGFQFQAVGALSPLLIDEYQMALADLGMLVGLYLAPGVLIAMPGGIMAGWIGDKRMVALGLLLMLLGSAATIIAQDWNAMVLGRVVAGTGAVMLNVVMTKMVVDWFSGREISTAMAIFLNSWPVGIALALLILPFVAGMGGLSLVWWIVALSILTGLVLFVSLYQPPPGLTQSAPSFRLSSVPVYALSLASLIWALYNAALAMVFSFGPVALNEAGWSPEVAGTIISAFMIIFSLLVPIGGMVADRTGRRDAVIFVSFAGFAVLMPFVPYASPATMAVIFVLAGALFSLAAGPIMTLPSAVLPEDSRTFGMGVFFTVYYLVMMIAPRISGGLADKFGGAATALHVGAGMCVISLVALMLFRNQNKA